jgi:hypothetical protein
MRQKPCRTRVGIDRICMAGCDEKRRPRGLRRRTFSSEPIGPVYFGLAGFQAEARPFEPSPSQLRGACRTVPALRLSASEGPTLCPGESHSPRLRVPLSTAEGPTPSRRDSHSQPQRVGYSAAETPTLCCRESYPLPSSVPLLPQCSRSDRSGPTISRPTSAPERAASLWRRPVSRRCRRVGAGTRSPPGPKRAALSPWPAMSS